MPEISPYRGESNPTLGGSVPHGVGEIRGHYFIHCKSMLHPLKVYVLSITSICFIHDYIVAYIRQTKSTFCCKSKSKQAYIPIQVKQEYGYCNMHLFGQPSGCNSAHQGQAAYSSGASSLPMLGKQRAPFWCNK